MMPPVKTGGNSKIGGNSIYSLQLKLAKNFPSASGAS